MTKARAQLALLLMVGCRPAPVSPVGPVAPSLSSPRVSQPADVQEQVAPLEQKCEGARLDLDWVVHAEECSRPGADTSELAFRLEPAALTVRSGQRDTVEFVVANDTATAQTYVVGYCDFRDGLTLAIADEAGHSVDQPGPCSRGMSCGGPPVAFTLVPGGSARWPLEFAAEARIEDETCEVVRRDPLVPDVYGITVSWHSRQTLHAELVVVEAGRLRHRPPPIRP